MDPKFYKWIINGAMAFAGIYIYTDWELTVLIPVGALVAAIWVFNDRFVDKTLREKSEIEAGPTQPFMPTEQQWDIKGDGFTRKTYVPASRRRFER